MRSLAQPRVARVGSTTARPVCIAPTFIDVSMQSAHSTASGGIASTATSHASIADVEASKTNEQDMRSPAQSTKITGLEEHQSAVLVELHSQRLHEHR